MSSVVTNEDCLSYNNESLFPPYCQATLQKEDSTIQHYPEIHLISKEYKEIEKEFKSYLEVPTSLKDFQMPVEDAPNIKLRHMKSYFRAVRSPFISYIKGICTSNFDLRTKPQQIYGDITSSDSISKSATNRVRRIKQKLEPIMKLMKDENLKLGDDIIQAKLKDLRLIENEDYQQIVKICYCIANQLFCEMKNCNMVMNKHFISYVFSYSLLMMLDSYFVVVLGTLTSASNAYAQYEFLQRVGIV